MANNLTYKQIDDWKKSVSTAITENLIKKSLKKIGTDAEKLAKITKSDSGDTDQLTYRFKDLQKLSTTATEKLTTFMKSFNSTLDTYLKTLKTAEDTAKEKANKTLDQFAESASAISKFKM